MHLTLNNLIEIAGVLTGLTSVFLIVKQNIWNWIFGITNAVIYAYIFYNVKLYPDVMLQFVFFTLSIYGWIIWVKGINEGAARKELPVTQLSLKENILTILGITTVAIAMGEFFKYYTKAAFPYTDSLTTTISLFAQYLMTIKKIENWILWIIADVVMIIMYHLKGLDMTAILFFIYLLLCIRGIWEWKNSMKNV